MIAVGATDNVEVATSRRHVPRERVTPGNNAAPTTSPSPGESSIGEPPLERMVALLVARLQERHPTAPPALVRQTIDDAVERFSTARVRAFLPILIERTAAEALRQASIVPDGPASSTRS